MAEYYPLILKAVTALEPSTAQTRRVLYDRARTALLTQLRSVQPALSEPDITRERLALEEAIRRVEADAVTRESESGGPAARGTDPRGASLPGAPDAAPPQPSPRAGQSQWRPEPAAAASPNDDRDDSGPAKPARRTAVPQPLEPPKPPGSVADRWVERARRQADEPFAPNGAAAPSYPGSRGHAAAGQAEGRQGEPRLDSRQMAAPETGRLNEPEPANQLPDWMRGREPAGETGLGAPARRQETSRSFAERDEVPQGPGQDSVASDWWSHTNEPPSFEDNEHAHGYVPADEDVPGAERGSVARSPGSAAKKSSTRKRIVGLGIMALALVAATVASLWKGPGIWIGGIGAVPPGAAEVNRSADPAVRSNGGTRGKIAERLPTAAQGASEGASSALRAVLSEIEESNSDRFLGTVAWRTESVPAVPGQKPVLTLRADIEIPERRMAIHWSLKRDDDPKSLFSHTIEITFAVPADFVHGAVGDIRGISMKQGENSAGSLLSGLGVKVKNNFFLRELLSSEGNLQYNIQLLKERSWLDILFTYTDGRQAIVSVEKGSSGERAFAAAFAAWGE